ncbi:MAG: hypothetical protein H6697_11150 [Myxococcales bacterium]|nr:hypothetical protein [Myxococcales bacterium]
MAAKNGRTPPRRPAPDVLRALAEQNTPDVRKEAKRYAEQRVPLLRAAFVPVSRRTPDDLVNDAITDTFLGDGDPWDPAECDLLTHLRGMIKKTTWQEIRHRMLVRREPLDLAGGNVEDVLARGRAHASMGDISPIMLAALVETICAELRKVDFNDEPAKAITECWELGFVERREVMLLTEMDDDTYKRARDRILSRKKFLPPKLLAIVEDLLDRSA